MSWFVEIAVQNRSSWIVGLRRYATSEEATSAARHLMRQWNSTAKPGERARGFRAAWSDNAVNAVWNFVTSKPEEIKQ